MPRNSAPRRRRAHQAPAPAGPVPTLPVVGIGASAGGLEALELFLGNVPGDAAMAFVVVMHQDPTHQGMLTELLQRFTRLQVEQVRDRTRVKAGCVYVIPPNKDMSILHGVLHLLDPVAARGLRLPIDFFLRSLAADCDERGIAVILSGMGSDGTLGLRAIKGKGGVVFVQRPDTARFDGMPRSAIATGLADVVAPADELPGRILAYSRHAAPVAGAGVEVEDASQGALGKILVLLRAETGHDFSPYKPSTMYRRIERRMSLHQTESIDAYVHLLRETPQELSLLFKDLLIGVTSFFRDAAAWDRLKSEITPGFLAARSPGRALRAWVPGCATGEEAYSLAIVLREALERVGPGSRLPLQLFATDLDAAAIDRARVGRFAANVALDVPPERLAHFFVPIEGGYQVVSSIRETVVFAVQNVCMQPPFTRLDILSCRNLLIYLSPEIQKKLLPLFHHALNPGGLLFLGAAESVGSHTDLFAPLDEKVRLYRRLDGMRGRERVAFPAPVRPAEPPAPRAVGRPAAPAELGALAERLLLDRYAPAAVLVDRRGEILYVSGRTGRYLEPAAGAADWRLLAMAREGIRHELARAFPRALDAAQPVTCENLLVETAAGLQGVNVTLQAVREPAALRGMVVVTFVDVARPASGPRGGRGKRASAAARVAELERQVEQLRRELHETREAMQGSLEESSAANEELQSANEELQSTNEELTTSREELQSMNEELETLNRELQARVDDLARTNSDVRNLLDSTEHVVLFLDGGLRLRLYTPGATRLFRLIPSDVGRSITDIASDLVLPDMEALLNQVLQTLAVHEQEVAARDGRWFALRIRPYRTLDNVIDGLVLTLADISAAKTLEAELRDVQAGREQRPEPQARKPDSGRSSDDDA